MSAGSGPPAHLVMRTGAAPEKWLISSLIVDKCRESSHKNLRLDSFTDGADDEINIFHIAMDLKHDLPSLSGITVLELGLSESGQYCGRLLADLGARVVSIEPSVGTASRRLPPFVLDQSEQKRSIVHEYLNTGKESVVVDFEDGSLHRLLRAFEGTADVLLHSAEWTDRLPENLAIPTVGTGLYGATGPRATAPTTSFTRFQAGGSGSIMPAPRPVAPGTLAGDCFAGAGLTMAVLAIIIARRRTEGGRSIVPKADHSEQAHFLNLEKMFIGRVSKDKASVSRESHRYPFGGAVRCKDGFVSMLINERHQWKGFCDAIGNPEWATDERFATGSDRFRMKDTIESVLSDWCATKTRAEVVQAMRTRQVPIGAVKEVGELASDMVFRSRGFVHDCDAPYGRAAVLGLPFGTDPIWHRRGRPYAPVLGEHTESVLRELETEAHTRAIQLVGGEHAGN